MFCRKCGKEMKPNEKFCPSCGAKVETEETVQAGSPIQNAPQSADRWRKANESWR